MRQNRAAQAWRYASGGPINQGQPASRKPRWKCCGEAQVGGHAATLAPGRANPWAWADAGGQAAEGLSIPKASPFGMLREVPLTALDWASREGNSARLFGTFLLDYP
jgi:hypothetical protein